MKILVAYDGSPAADAAVAEVAARPWPAGSEIRLVTVVERPMAVPPPNGIEIYAPLYERMRASLREEAYRRVQSALERLRDVPGVQASYELRDGDVKDALLSAIRDWGADLVIAGSRGVSGIARLVLGSVSHALVTHSPCSVEIVKSAPNG